MTPKEQEDEKMVAAIFRRPQRKYIFDPPTYPFFPTEPRVNFDLGYRF